MIHLLSQTATVHSAGIDITDAEGITTTTYTDAIWPCRLEQAETVEVDTGRGVVTSTWRIFLPPDAALNAHDELTVDGSRFQVAGRPNVPHSPRGPSHIEARLTLVED